MTFPRHHLDPSQTYTIWTCSSCGTEYPYPDRPPIHGGPRQRGLDRRYGFLNSCWRSKQSKCKSHTNKSHRVLLLSPGAPNPEQPDQPDLDNIKAIIASKKGRK